MACIFPWVEEEQSAYSVRVQKDGRKALDYALKHFLDTLVTLRTVLLQDAAVLYAKHPECAVWKFKPFNTTAFAEFARTSTVVLYNAELDAKRKLQSLPETVAGSMRGIVESIDIQQSQARKDQDARFDFIEGLLIGQISSKSRGRGGLSSISSGLARMFFNLLLLHVSLHSACSCRASKINSPYAFESYNG